MKEKILLILSLFIPFFTIAQSLDTLKCLIRDTTGFPIPGANVWVYMASDSFHTVSNDNGYVKFLTDFSNEISLKISSIGYEESRVFVGKKPFFEVVLKEKMNILKEVVVKGFIHPVILKEDTVEYDVKHFIQSPDDVIQDLLARLPGLQVNSDGSINMLGQSISKIKINGQDLMVGDITTLTSIIRANLISKIQLIDDYGEKSRLTGRKTGESEKIINLTTTGKIDGIYAGRFMLAKGTGKLYALYGNLFRYSDQQSIHVLLFNDNIGNNIGKTSNTEGELSFNKKFSKNIVFRSNFGYKLNSSDFESKSKIETITNEGLLYNDLNSKGRTASKIISSNIEMVYNPEGKNRLDFHFKENLHNNSNNGLATNIQSGFQRKDQYTTNDNNNNNNEIEGELLFSHKFNKARRVFLIQIGLKDRSEKISNYSNNKLRFYSNDTGLYSDSILNQLIIGQGYTRDYKTQLSYIEPINDKTSLEFNYSYSKSYLTNKQTTNWMDQDGKYFPVDTLKNDYNFNIGQQQIEINLQYKKGLFEGIVGGNIRPYKFSGNSSVSGLPFFPVLQFSYNKKNMTSIKLNYNGESIFPTFQQLSLVPNYSDIQNPIYGNPNLKAAQKHNISLSFFRTVKSNNFMFKLLGSIVHNNIVSNIFMINDVLGTLKQETHFINSNGNFMLENMDSWARQFKNETGIFEVQVGGSFLQNMLYYNSQKKNTQTWNSTIKIGVSYNPNIFNLSLKTNYTFSKSNFSINNNSILSHTINVNSYNIIAVNNNLKCEFICSKQLNFGFGSALNYNPLMLDIRINKWWWKKKFISTLEINNLLNENSQITQSINNNVISASTHSNRGRYFILKFMFDIKNM